MTAPVLRREVWEGPRDDVASRCLAARQTGRLVRMARPEPVSRLRDRVRVEVVVVADRAAAPAAVRPPVKRPSTGQIAVGTAVGCGLVVVGGVVYLLAQLVRWVEQHALQLGLLLGALVALVLIFGRPNHRPACSGLHCAGCRG